MHLQVVGLVSCLKSFDDETSRDFFGFSMGEELDIFLDTSVGVVGDSIIVSVSVWKL